MQCNDTQTYLSILNPSKKTGGGNLCGRPAARNMRKYAEICGNMRKYAEKYAEICGKYAVKMQGAWLEKDLDKFHAGIT